MVENGQWESVKSARSHRWRRMLSEGLQKHKLLVGRTLKLQSCRPVTGVAVTEFCLYRRISWTRNQWFNITLNLEVTSACSFQNSIANWILSRCFGDIWNIIRHPSLTMTWTHILICRLSPDLRWQIPNGTVGYSWVPQHVWHIDHLLVLLQVLVLHGCLLVNFFVYQLLILQTLQQGSWPSANCFHH